MNRATPPEITGDTPFGHHDGDVEDIVINLLVQFDEALLSGSVNQASVLIDTIPNELTEVVQSNQQFLAFLHEAARAAGTTISTRSLGQAISHLSEVPKSFGRFQVVRELGHGSQGVVFLAFDPALKRHVALKVPRWDSILRPENRRRFQREAEIVARLTHPNIVAVHEVEIDEPILYIASDFCEGPTLADWLRDHPAPVAPDSAARLIETLAWAVQYAHSRGVVHRDLKPGNVILTTEAASAQGDMSLKDLDSLTPKLTDFGLARLEDGSEGTRTGVIMGTPAYMSPEQAEGKSAKIGPATDVYGLGAIFYEMLTASRPIQGETDADTIRRIVSDDPVHPRRIRNSIDRDLEAICLKCLEKNPSHRYLSAEELANDLRRYREGLPTYARPIGPFGQALKTARKFPTVAALVLAVMALLAVSAVGASFAALKISAARRQADLNADNQRRERERAELAETDAIESAREAQQKAIQARQVTQFLTNLFQSSDPTGLEAVGFRKANEGASELTAAMLLDRGRDQIKTALLDQPLERAELLDVLGNVYRSLGKFSDAGPLLKESIEIRAERLTMPHSDLAQSYLHYGWLLLDTGRYPEAEQNLRKALEMQSTLFGEESIEAATTKFHLGWTIANNRAIEGRFHIAKDLIGQSMRTRERLLGKRHHDVAVCLTALASIEVSSGNYDAATSLGLRSLMILGSTEDGKVLFRAVAEYQKAVGERRSGNLDRAAKHYERALAGIRSYLGDRHPGTALLLGDYAGFLRQSERFVDAERVAREAIHAGKQIAPDGHPELTTAMRELADVLVERGDHVEAREILTEALRMNRLIYGEDHLETAVTILDLARLEQFRENTEEAARLAREGYALAARQPLESYLYASCLQNLAIILDEQGNKEESDNLLKKTKKAFILAKDWYLVSEMERSRIYARYFRSSWTEADRQTMTEWAKGQVAEVHHPATRAEGYLWLARASTDGGEMDSALSMSELALTMSEKGFPPGNCHIVAARIARGLALQAAGRLDEAEPLLRQGYLDIRRIRGTKSIVTEHARRSLVEHYRKAGKEDLAAEYEAHKVLLAD